MLSNLKLLRPQLPQPSTFLPGLAAAKIICSIGQRIDGFEKTSTWNVISKWKFDSKWVQSSIFIGLEVFDCIHFSRSNICTRCSIRCRDIWWGTRRNLNSINMPDRVLADAVIKLSQHYLDFIITTSIGVVASCTHHCFHTCLRSNVKHAGLNVVACSLTFSKFRASL